MGLMITTPYNKCRVCGARSLMGLKRGSGLCPYHHDVYVYGQRYADTLRSQIEDGRNEAAWLRQRQQRRLRSEP